MICRIFISTVYLLLFFNLYHDFLFNGSNKNAAAGVKTVRQHYFVIIVFVYLRTLTFTLRYQTSSP